MLLSAVVIAAISLTSGIAQADTIYVSNNENSTVEEISNGVSSTLISSFLNDPTGIAVYGNDLYVANNGSPNGGYVAEFTLSGSFVGVVVGGLASPRGISFDSAGNLYVANQDSGVIVKVPTGVGVYPSALTTGLGNLNGMTIGGSGNLYAVSGNGNLYSISTTTGVANILATGLPDGLNNPVGITYDSVGANAGNLFVVDNGDHTVVEYNATTGAIVNSPFLTSLNNNSQLDGIAVDTAGNFFIDDSYTNTVTEYNSLGQFVTAYSSGIAGPCYVTVTSDPLAVPEPSTYLLGLGGIAALFFYFQRSRQLVRI